MSEKPKLPRRRSRLFPLPVQHCLETLIAPAIKERGFAEARILTHWPQIVGAQLAAQTRPVAIRGAHGARVLQVMVSPAFAMQLHYSHPAILERIATFVGFRAVGSLQITQRALPVSSEQPVGLPPLSLPLRESSGTPEPEDALEGALAGLAKALQERRGMR